MTSRIPRWGCRALPLWAVCLLVPPAGTHPALGGTAGDDATHPDGRLLKIDYTAGTVLATFNSPPRAVIGDGFSGVAARPGSGQIAATDGLGTNNVYRFDPDTGAVLGSFVAPTTNSTIDGLEFSNGELYASQRANSVIYHINPDTGALIGTLPNSLPGNVQGGLTIAGGVHYSRGSSGNTTVARRDLTTGAVLGQLPAPGNQAVTALATDGASLYEASDAGVIYHCDPVTGAVPDFQNMGIALDGLGGPAPAPVPEPSTGWLILSAVLACRAWRRSRLAAFATPVRATTELVAAPDPGRAGLSPRACSGRMSAVVASTPHAGRPCGGQPRGFYVLVVFTTDVHTGLANVSNSLPRDGHHSDANERGLAADGSEHLARVRPVPCPPPRRGRAR